MSGTGKNDDFERFDIENAWSIRPCFLYKEEYDDCTSIKARFHQYFIFGKNIDCTQWKKDYDNCIKYRNDKNYDAAKDLIKSEEDRRKIRLSAHYSNDVWKKRNKPPPDDWSKSLPEWMEKKNENTFLQIKTKELNNKEQNTDNNQNIQFFNKNFNSLCMIM